MIRAAHVGGLLLALACAGTAAGQVRVDAEIGWEPSERLARVPGWVTFLVRLQNDGLGEVAGTLVVEGLRHDEHEHGPVAHEYPITLGPGTVKLYRDAAYAPEGTRFLRVRADFGQTGGAAWEEVFPLTLLDPRSVLVLHLAPETVPSGWLSTAEGGLPLLRRVIVPGIRPELIPERVEGWADVDVLFVEGGSLGTWSPAQRGALVGWVVRGGHLMVAPGPLWPAENEPVLGKLLPLEYRAAGDPPAGETITWLAHVPAWSPASGTIVYQTAPRQGFGGRRERSWKFAGGQSPAAVTARVGLGRVTQWTFSPGLSGLRDWAGARLLLHLLFFREQPDWVDPADPAHAAAIQGWAKRRALALLPSVDRVGLLLAAYVGAVLPGLWLLARALRRPLWFWALLPLFSVLAGLWLLRRAPPAELAVRELRLRQGELGSSQAWELPLIHLQSPGAAGYAVDTEERGGAVPVRVWTRYRDSEEATPEPAPRERWRVEGAGQRTHGLQVRANDSVTFAVPGLPVEVSKADGAMREDSGSRLWLRLGDAGEAMGDGLLVYGDRVWRLPDMGAAAPAPGPGALGWMLLGEGYPLAGSAVTPREWPEPVEEVAQIIGAALPVRRPWIWRWVPADDSAGRGWTVLDEAAGVPVPMTGRSRVLEGRPLGLSAARGTPFEVGPVTWEWEVEMYQPGRGSLAGPVSPYGQRALGLFECVLQVSPVHLPPGLLQFDGLDLEIEVGPADGGDEPSAEVEIYDLANDRWVRWGASTARRLAATDTPAGVHPATGTFWVRVPASSSSLLELRRLRARLRGIVWSE